MTTPTTIAWLMRAAGCDGSADWIEPGAAEPEPMAGFEAVPLGDVREMQAEFDRLRDALRRERASSGRYMEERNQARLQAQREVGEDVRRLRAERDELRAEVDRITAAGRAHIRRAAAFEAQRDELLAALRALMQMDVRGHTLEHRLQFSDAGRELLGMASAAIARAEGGAA